MPADLFRALEFPDLQRYVDEGREEGLHLEFKTVKGASFNSQDDKRNFARALSGFANSAGGIIVWGIDARRDTEGVDRASAMIPIDPAAQLLARLNELTGEFVEPRVDGVLHRAILSEGTAGVVLSLVPESLTGPHMAKAGEDRYYKRSGDSFYRMEHFDIGDMFGRRQQPDLAATIILRSDGSMSSGGVKRHRIRAILGISNSGRGSAVAPYISLRVHDPYRIDAYGIDGNRNEGLPRVASTEVGVTAYGGSTGVVIHPGTIHPVCAVRIEMLSPGSDPADLVVEYRVTAQDVRMKDGEVRISGATIISSHESGIPSTGA